MRRAVSLLARLGLAKVRLSIWLSLAALILSTSFVTWRYMVAAALEGKKPSIFAIFGWTFWMMVLAVVFIWGCWVKTEAGWRWRR